ncbi:elongation factor 4 [Candidatus Profftella armatura (Diaphorina cf. continua)]|uniref:Elongation factor 4 n=1 Tax=Candidatus Profftella armatura (Diaphorina cf. continua) TaxID=2661583 RepID=A0A7R6W0X4_9PROT|nr:translation elongation factor 4 [Candidatus Profftella armatura (Diaphorina cf. continua)]BCG49660.1 elongation factor 4 [Candidatus Profftella armatura (Diaphorina cf. continua)]
MKNIRNFSIIAHIDHGKSTLADRIIQICGGLSTREMESQVLDSMDIERERGITIKAQTAALSYKAKNGLIYNLNLIDTPGHVDFSYEVNRSLSACEGALLLIDATQGVEAQTVANCYMAIDMNVKVIPVLNKIDLPNANINNTLLEIENIIGINSKNAIFCSGKTGFGVLEILENLISKIPHPKGNIDAPLQALIIDSWFDNYVGVVMLVRVINGKLHIKEKILLMSNGTKHLVENIGIFTPKSYKCSSLSAGQVGFIVAGIKEVKIAKVGDTITLANFPSLNALPGFKKVQPQVFSGLFPLKNNEFNTLKKSLEKLKLNDSALKYNPETSQALGFGFRCGFLGLLHMEIVQERLKREFNIDLITTAPTVIYKVLMKNNTILMIDNPSKIPETIKILEIQEPIVIINLYTPKEYVGVIMNLCIHRRGIQINIDYHGMHVKLTYEIPMSEIIFDFFDTLKSISHGFASMEYEFKEYRSSDVIKLDILINNEKIDALSSILHRINSRHKGKAIVAKMKELIPRQMFDVIIQATIGANIIARENIKSLRKNVLAKCYGGDISRKKKLLEKQKAGKKNLKQIGVVGIPKEAFLAILKIDKKK